MTATPYYVLKRQVWLPLLDTVMSFCERLFNRRLGLGGIGFGAGVSLRAASDSRIYLWISVVRVLGDFVAVASVGQCHGCSHDNCAEKTNKSFHCNGIWVSFIFIYIYTIHIFCKKSIQFQRFFIWLRIGGFSSFGIEIRLFFFHNLLLTFILL